MKNYNVFFEAFGKKYQMKVDAENKFDAEQAIKDKIIFHKIVDISETHQSIEDDLYDSTKELFNKLMGIK